MPPPAFARLRPLVASLLVPSVISLPLRHARLIAAPLAVVKVWGGCPAVCLPSQEDIPRRRLHSPYALVEATIREVLFNIEHVFEELFHAPTDKFTKF